MTEPGIGSDLASMTTTAIRDGDHYVVNGSKTFITNGINADVVVTAVKTDPAQRHRGMSLLVLERGMDGLRSGAATWTRSGCTPRTRRSSSSTTCGCRSTNRLGDEGAGFLQLMANLPQERLSIAVTGVAAARAAFDRTLAYAKERQAFGQPIASFQHNRFVLAEMATEIEIGQSFVDRCVRGAERRRADRRRGGDGEVVVHRAAGRVIDRGVQLHGGYGYMTEYPIGRAYADARITRIYGGTTEIMKEIIGRSLGI